MRRSALLVLLAAAPLAACSAMSRFTSMTGNAIVVYEPTRGTDAAIATGLLRERGWKVDLAESGPAHRSRSSLALYGQHHRTGIGIALTDVLRPLVGEIDVLPFLTEGPGLHDAVLWLADAK